MGKDADLIQAVKAEDLMTVCKILGKCSTAHSKKSIGSVKQLNVNQQDADGLTVLHHAALAGNHNLMKLLLEHGIQVDVKDNKGLRPLHYASWLGKEKPVEVLLQYRALVNHPALDGATPLHLACEHGHSDVVQMLLVNKADPSLANCQHKTPLDLACEFGRKQVVELLLACDLSNRLRSECSADVLENDRTTCLHLAARNGHVDVLKLLIEFGFNINRQTPSGTCLHEAAKYGKTEVVRLLLSYGIDVSRLNSYEETALEIVNKFTASRAAKELKQMLKEASSEVLARAVRDYSKPLDASHLMFKEGDIIMVVDRFSKSGLWKGYCSSASGHTMHAGYFPSDAVVILDLRTAADKTSFDVLPNSVGLPRLANDAVANQTTMSSSISSVNADEAEEGIRDPHQPLLPVRTKSSSDINRDSGFSANNSCFGHSCTAAEIANGLQNRLSGQSSESGVSGISSYQASSSQSTASCSQGSLDNLDESSFSSSSVKVHDLLHSDLPESELLSTWLRDLHLDEFAHLFINAGYNLPTVSRMTPEDLTAIGITQPSVRKKLKSEIAQLTIPDGIPDFRPQSVKEWLNFLHLGEYNDMLIRQGCTDIDSITGIMWEDLEEIGIQKLGHQKKIMLAIDRLKKISGSLHLQPTPISPVSSPEVQGTSSTAHFTSNFSPASIISCNPHADSFGPASSRNYSPSYDVKRRVNLNSSGEPHMLSTPINAPSFNLGSGHTTHGSHHGNMFPLSCQSCSSFRRNCENICQNEIIGPAPPLPCKATYKPGLSSTITRNGMLTLAEEMENLAVTNSHEDWFSDKKQNGKMKTKCREMPCDMYSGAKDYHLSSYGTLPRGFSSKGKGSNLCQCYGAAQNNFYDWYEAESKPMESFSNAGLVRDFDRHMCNIPTPPKCMNSFKNDAPLLGIAGEKLRSETSSTNPFQSSGRRLLDAVNLEGNFRHFCDVNYRPSGFSHPENQSYHRERFLSNEITASNCLNQAPANFKNYGMTYKGEFKRSKTAMVAEILEKSNLIPVSLNCSGLSSSQNLSSVSLNSSDSSGTLDGNSLPFANEDFGTIKERNTSSVVTEKSADATSTEQNDVDTKECCKDGLMMKDRSSHQLLNDLTEDVDATRHQNSGSKRNTEAVFDDIDGMLLGLTQELDEMLKLQA